MNKQRKARPDPIQRWIKCLQAKISVFEFRVLELQQRIETSRELISTLKPHVVKSPDSGPGSTTDGSSNNGSIK